jgi:hypothetical protein
MDRKRNSEKPEPQEHPIEPEMERRPDEDPKRDETDPAQPAPAG